MTNDEIYSGILSDTAIRHYWNKGILIQTEHKSGPLAFDLEKQLQPGSIDLRFRNDISRLKSDENEVLSFERLTNKDYLSPDIVPTNGSLIIQPNEIILTTTLETVHLSENFAGIITGRSSFARLGLMVQCCQDFINPGLKNSIALQLVNLSPYPIELDINVPICQLIIIKMAGKPSVGYSEKETAKYTGEKKFIPSKIMDETTQKPLPVHQWQQIKNFIHKWIEPFLVGIINILIITPFLKAYGKINIIQILGNAPIEVIIAIFSVIIFIFIKKDNKK